MSETDDEEEERDAPTAVGKVSERLLKALKERNATDAKVVSSAPSKNETPTQPPPPAATEDEDESATNVLIQARGIPVRRAEPKPPPESDEDKSETLYAITAQTGRTPAVPPVKEAPPPPPAEVPGSHGPIVAPLVPPPSALKFWAVPAIIAACILALAAWVVFNRG